MRTLLTAPATNDRGPRYMERTLAAIHTSTSAVRSQANHERQCVTLEYGTHDRRVGLFVLFPETIEELVTGPITANYPNCSIGAVDDEDVVQPGWQTWTAELELVPERMALSAIRCVSFLACVVSAGLVRRSGP